MKKYISEEYGQRKSKEQIEEELDKESFELKKRMDIDVYSSFSQFKAHCLMNSSKQDLAPVYVRLRKEEIPAMLRNKGKNRTIDRSTIKRYRDDMNSGKWDYSALTTSAPVMFTSEFQLAGGQHRLTAFEMSNKDYLIFPISGNVTNGAVIKQDSGKGRSKSDVQELEYDIPAWTTPFARGGINSACKMMFLKDNNMKWNDKNIGAKQIDEIMKKYSEAGEHLSELLLDHCKRNNLKVGNTLCKKAVHVAALLYSYNDFSPVNWKRIVASFLTPDNHPWTRAQWAPSGAGNQQDRKKELEDILNFLPELINSHQ